MTLRGVPKAAILLAAAALAGVLVLPTAWLLAPLIVRDVPDRCDAIVLLAGDYRGRAPTVARLYRAGYAPEILLTDDGVFSGWSARYNRNLYQVEWAEEELVGLGVPRERVRRLPYCGSSTMIEAVTVRRYLAGRGLKRILVVTSDYHTRRALWSFRLALRGSAARIAVFPAPGSGVGRHVLAREYLKYWYYRVRYGVFGLPEAPEIGHVPRV